MNADDNDLAVLADLHRRSAAENREMALWWRAQGMTDWAEDRERWSREDEAKAERFNKRNHENH